MKESTIWSGVRVTTVDIGSHPPIVLVVDVEEDRAWLIAHMGDKSDARARTTPNDRLFYRKNSWARRDKDPRAEWAKCTPLVVASVSLDLLFHLAIISYYFALTPEDEKAVRIMSDALTSCEPAIIAALVMDS